MIYFRRPIHIIDTREEGYAVPDSFIVFGRKPWVSQSRILSPEERIEKGYAIENEVIQWKYKLRIDLWVVVFDYIWYGKVRMI